MVILASLIVFFAYFYTAIQFDPTKQADNLRKQGGFIPGIRPGAPTANYLNDILVRITLPGCALPGCGRPRAHRGAGAVEPQPVPFGGTSVLIAVGCRARDDEADRVPAAHASLRGLPEVGGLPCGSCCSGPRGQARERRRSAWWIATTSPRSPRVTSFASTSKKARRSGSRRERSWTVASSSAMTWWCGW